MDPWFRIPLSPAADIATAIVHEGDRAIHLHRDDASVPALLQAGGILALAAEHETDATANPAHLEVRGAGAAARRAAALRGEAALLRTATAPRSVAARLAEIRAQNPPDALLTALTEFLTALRPSSAGRGASGASCSRPLRAARTSARLPGGPETASALRRCGGGGGRRRGP